MILLFRGKKLDEDYHLEIGSEYDVCTLCAESLMREQHISQWDAEQQLKNDFIGKPVFKLNIRGTKFTICPDCIEKILFSMKNYIGESVNKPEPESVPSSKQRSRKKASDIEKTENPA